MHNTTANEQLWENRQSLLGVGLLTGIGVSFLEVNTQSELRLQEGISRVHNLLHEKFVSTMAVASPGKLNLSQSSQQGARSIDCYQKLEKIGEGTYGQVYMAREIETGEIVAIKKIRMDNKEEEEEGFPITAIREIKILKKLNHQNVVKLKEVVTSPKGEIFMVFEYMDHDLWGLSRRPGVSFGSAQIKCYMKQLLTGLHYCHLNQVLHRDIKDANLLIDNRGNLKLADFGLARSVDREEKLTSRVITLWYRPPELLLGAKKYGPSVDMWSVGCIFAGLLHRKPILPGKDEPEQVNMIFELCGAPDEVNWPDVSKLPKYKNFKPSRPMKNRLREVFRHFGGYELNLLEKMLTLDPLKRISAKDALDDEYFWIDPLPADPKSLPSYESSHELQTRELRRQHEEVAKRRKLQHPQQQYACLPPRHQSVQLHFQPRHEPKLPMRNSQPAHHYEKSQGVSRGRAGDRTLQRGNSDGVYSATRALAPSAERTRYTETGLPGQAARGGDSGYRGGRNNTQGSPRRGSDGRRGPMASSGNRSRHYSSQ